MYFRYITFIVVALFVSCKSEITVNTDPSAYLTDEHQKEFKYSIIRWAGKRAPKATDTTLYDPQFEDYYKELAAKHDLKSYYIDSLTRFHYFMLYRIAPSVHVKKVALGGRLKYDDENNISYYEEIFRTYKMPESELDAKATLIFRDLILKNSIDKYLFKNTQPEEYIEFPDDETYYDISNRRWVSSRFDPVQEMKNEIDEELKKNRG